MSELTKALQEIELRCTQARIASGIGKRTKQQRIDFLLGELERIATVARNAADGGEIEVPS